MTSLVQLLLTIVILVLTFLIVFVAFQAAQVFSEFRLVLKKFNRILEEESPTPKFTKHPKSTHTAKRFFHRKQGQI